MAQTTAKGNKMRAIPNHKVTIQEGNGKLYVWSEDWYYGDPGPIVPNDDQDRSYHAEWGLFDNDDADMADPDPGPAWA